MSKNGSLIVSLLLLACGCASDAPPPTLLDAYPDYRGVATATVARNSKQGEQVAQQGCEALHRGFVDKSQRWVDCASGDQELMIRIFALPETAENADAATELVSMIAMVESSWCLSHKLVTGVKDAAVTIVHPDGNHTVTPCVHFLER